MWRSSSLALCWVLFASLLFYAHRIPWHALLLIGVSAIAFVGGRLAGSERSRRHVFAGASIILALTPLLIFKYSAFFSGLLSELIGAGDLPDLTKYGLILPLGISFFTFQNIGYIADRFRGVFATPVSAFKYAVYVVFFPQLVAGPIVTAREFLPQLESKSFFHNRDYILGSTFLALGYFKKALLADSLAGVADPVFATPGAAGSLAVLLAVLAYAMQIYFDFSGYSDIAIGIGLWFGFRLPENFSYPYSADSFRDFWRRWHITLSRWLRDHLYIPLGGNRLGVSRMYFALLATMLLGGLWHGAHLNFVLWGAGHGILLIAERWIPMGWRNWSWFGGIYRVFVLTSIVLLWIPFRAGSEADGFAVTAEVIQRLFVWTPGDFREADLRLVVGFLALLGIGSIYGERLLGFWDRLALPWRGALLAIAAILLLLLAPGGGAFIYFVF
ncbi:MAG: MBOAT family protein [bacterium]|nr:MBOAT family protein [bacterium]